MQLENTRHRSAWENCRTFGESGERLKWPMRELSEQATVRVRTSRGVGCRGHANGRTWNAQSNEWQTKERVLPTFGSLKANRADKRLREKSTHYRIKQKAHEREPFFEIFIGISGATRVSKPADDLDTSTSAFTTKMKIARPGPQIELSKRCSPQKEVRTQNIGRAWRIERKLTGASKGDQ